MFNHVVVIAGVPRSGTSWLGQIVDSSPGVNYRFQPLFSYAFKDSLNIDSRKHEYENFFRNIYESNDEFLLQTEKRKEGLYPTFEKKRNPDYLAIKTCRYQYLLMRMLHYFENLKLLAIVRHPCGVINSWLSNPKEFPKDAVPGKEWRFGACRNAGREEEFFGFYKWKEVAHSYLDLHEKYPHQVYIIKYEELVESPLVVTQSVFDFVGLDVTEQTVSFLNTCHSVHKEGPYAVFKEKVVKDRWRRELDPNIASQIICEIEGTRLSRFLT